MKQKRTKQIPYKFLSHEFQTIWVVYVFLDCEKEGSEKLKLVNLKQQKTDLEQYTDFNCKKFHRPSIRFYSCF